MRFPTLVALLLALSVPATATAAGPRFLPPVKDTLMAGTTTKRTCATRLLPDRLRGIERSSYRAPMGGFVNVRLSGPRRGNWDLAVFDRKSGRRLAASQGFTSTELAQTWVASGQRLSIQACRRSGPGRAARVSTQLIDIARPKSAGTPQLLRVRVDNGAQLHLLEGLGVDVTHQIHDGHADVIVTGAKQRNLLARAGFEFKTVIADMNEHFVESRKADLEFSRRVRGRSALPSGRTTYRDLFAYQTEMAGLVAARPDIVRPVVLPKRTTQGREIQGVEISKDVNAPQDGRPTWFVVAMHHAREWPSGEIAMELAHMLVREYGTDARITNLVDRARIVIVPIINVDSFVFTQEAVSPADTYWYGGTPAQPIADTRFPAGTPQVGGKGTGYVPYLGEQFVGAQAYRRKTCSGAFPAGTPCERQWGTDPNRNYGEGWGGVGASSFPHDLTYRGTGPWSEPETQAVHEFSQQRQVTNIITIHNVAALVLRSPGRRSDGLAPDEPRMKAIGDAMAAATGYRSQYGWQLYDTSGTTEDWNYAAQGAFGYTIEVGPGGDSSATTGTPQNYDPDSSFHMPYERGVVREWEGWNTQTGVSGGGLREAMLIAGESAINPADHSVLEGTAPAGRVLRAKKEFETRTSPVCRATVSFPVRFLNPPLSEVTTDKCVAPGDRISIPDRLDTTMVVPASGTFEWHVNPSTRPFVRGRYETVTTTTRQESYSPAAGETLSAGGSRLAPNSGGHEPPAASTTTRTFTVTSEDRASRLVVDLTADVAGGGENTNPEDYDVYLSYKKADGTLEPIGAGRNDVPSGAATWNVTAGQGVRVGPNQPERITVQNPPVGEYVAKIVNRVGRGDSWKLDVTRVNVEDKVVLTGVTEKWTVTCESADGQTVYETHQVLVDRGQRVTLNMPCGATTTPPKKDKKPKPPRNPKNG